MANRRNTSCANCPAFSRSVFFKLDSQALHHHDSTRQERVFASGENLFSEEESGAGFYCLESGAVSIYSELVAGKQRLSAIRGPSHLIGCPSGIESWGKGASTLKPVKACYVSRESINTMAEADNAILMEITRHICLALVDATRALTVQRHSTLRERVVFVLVGLIQQFGEQAPGGLVSLNLPVSRSDLADLSGTVTESVVRILRELKDEKVITTKSGSIAVLDVVALSHALPDFLKP